ncbi:hypothetical protein R2083_05485 [Nitrosomonas sp. Is35]|uniref:hypothetical protein n=1 Tax=unclassified Nitrosomonas TaxID=2609265 RepID=UPI000A0B0715|nr:MULTISPECIES: hypothetical protein [unclassified Nitrosomonas]MBX9916278.1 hypothetical protein [Nitrosomonas sp.]MDV6341790.1 hypothetical protein [Nitrosomonas sp. Is24]MDV6346967.1 hypothetical protein [Nitrosomonas sp. Is35]OQW84983.1 MAG: hypothetical protein BVN30_02165 [Proteobacteria bacterium ST_bin16]
MMYDLVDKVFKALLSLNEEDERKFADVRKDINHINHILHDMVIIDTKSSALLTHVSVMLAVVIGMLFTLIGPKESGSILAYMLKIEMVSYAIVAMVLLRCLDIMGPPFRKLRNEMHEIDAQYHQEIVTRRAIYQLMSRVVFILTVVLILITFLKIFGFQ